MTLKMQIATNMVVNIDMPHLEKFLITYFFFLPQLQITLVDKLLFILSIFFVAMVLWFHRFVDLIC